MIEYISKSALVAEIERLMRTTFTNFDEGVNAAAQTLLEIIDTLEVKEDPYELCVQYDSIKDAIQAHAETYSFNIASELFNQLTKEQQKLWREEIEQACISGGDAGYTLAKDPRYKENLEVKEVDLGKELDSYFAKFNGLEKNNWNWRIDSINIHSQGIYDFAKYFFELGQSYEN